MGEVVEIIKYAAEPRTKIIPDALIITTFAEARRIFLLNCRAKNLSRRTMAWYERKLNEFDAFINTRYTGLSLPDITPDVLRGYICYLQEKENMRYKGRLLSSYTVAGIVRVLRVFFHFLAEEGYLPANPCEKIKIPKVQKKIIKPLSEEEIERLLSLFHLKTFTGLRNYVIVLVFLDTGMRLSELIGLKIADIDWERSTLKVLGKGNKEREVPFGGRVARMLAKYLKWRGEIPGQERVFLNESKDAFKSRRLGAMIQYYGKKAGIERLHPHKFRHTVALQWIRAGGDVLSLQRILGHTSLDMVRHYVFLAAEDTSAKHRQFGLVDRLPFSEGNGGKKHSAI